MNKPSHIYASWKACRARRVAKTKAWLDSYRLKRGCRRCGYKEHPAALDFAHRNRRTKLFGVLRAATAGWALSKIKKEVAKCDVLCANCHRIETTEENTKLRGCSNVDKGKS